MKNYTQAELDIAVRTERNRFKLVMTSAEYNGREIPAQHMLQDTNLNSAAIIAALSGITTEQGQPKHPSTDNPQGAQQNDFEQGKKIASNLPASLRRADG